MDSFFSSWNIANSLSLLALIVSSATLFLGFLAYKKFLVKQAQQKQLDIVLDLIKQIHKDKNKYSIFDRGGIYIDTPVSMFDIATEANFNKDEKMYFIRLPHLPIKVDHNFKSEHVIHWGFFDDFYKNPLLPLSIAKKLSVFNMAGNCSLDSVDSLKARGGIMFGNRPIDEVREICCTMHPPLSKADSFQNAAKELKQAIVVWLKSYGIKDINLMED